MKKSYFFIGLVIGTLIIIACNNSSHENKFPQDTSATNALINSGGQSVDSVYRNGARLIVANDCFTCHDIEKKMRGPSYRDIANKYHYSEGVVDNLSNGIINGSKGIWGQEAMTPHPNVTFINAMEMVKYILSLKTNT